MFIHCGVLAGLLVIIVCLEEYDMGNSMAALYATCHTMTKTRNGYRMHRAIETWHNRTLSAFHIRRAVPGSGNFTLGILIVLVCFLLSIPSIAYVIAQVSTAFITIC